MNKGAILVVDDEPILCEVLRDDLETEGYLVLIASSGRMALEIIANNDVALVLSDARMANGDGLFLATELYKRSPNRPAVVLITGHSELNLDEVKSVGVKAVLSKQYAIELLLEKVRDLMNQ